jgi:hypothetical protein
MLQAYLNDEKLKINTVAAMKADIKAERLVKGHYWNASNGNGCFVGCVIRGNAHADFEVKLGIPRILARLADRIFEGLEYSEAKKFSVDFLETIKVGSNLSLVWPKFAVFILADKDCGVLKFARTDKTKKAIQDVVNLYQRIINGEKIDANTWLEARNNAYAAASAASAASADAYAAYAAASASAAADAASAADAYAASADAYAAYAAASAAADADAASADAYAAARSRHFAALATYLVKLFREAE